MSDGAHTRIEIVNGMTDKEARVFFNSCVGWLNNGTRVVVKNGRHTANGQAALFMLRSLIAGMLTVYGSNVVRQMLDETQMPAWVENEVVDYETQEVIAS
jgi:hypothetical protein